MPFTAFLVVLFSFGFLLRWVSCLDRPFNSSNNVTNSIAYSSVFRRARLRRSPRAIAAFKVWRCRHVIVYFFAKLYDGRAAAADAVLLSESADRAR